MYSAVADRPRGAGAHVITGLGLRVHARQLGSATKARRQGIHSVVDLESRAWNLGRRV